MSEDFRLHQRGDTEAYLQSRGFKLFETLNGNLRALLEKKKPLPGANQEIGPTWRKTQLDDNWAVHTKEVREIDFVEYEVFSVLDSPTDKQLRKLDSEAQLLCFPELDQYRGGDRIRKLEIGLKIGGKTQEMWNRWVEKWAKFEIG